MTDSTTLAAVALGLALLPAAVAARNLRLFRPPPPATDGVTPRVSVLIPARNEERAIGPALDAVLSSVGVELEVVVLDDQSADRTADVVRAYAARDARVRLESAPPLPPGWCGKQHACHTLAGLAAHDVLTFLDADVRLAPDALARLAAFQRATGAALVSGFPRQETGTAGEKLVIPLINWLVAGYLPVGRMRASAAPGYGAGCGQWFLTTRVGYAQAGGHAAIRTSLHDGVKLPRAYRAAGLATDICDATDLATCRMYRDFAGVWFGLAKNAREGLAGPVGVWVWTLLLLGGHVLPWALLAGAVAGVTWDGFNQTYFPGFDTATAVADHRITLGLAGGACAASVGTRVMTALRFRQSLFGALLHPVGVSLLVGIQWYATVMTWAGRPVGWKGRPHPSLTPAGTPS